MSEDGGAEGPYERDGRTAGPAIPTLPLVERSSTRNTRRTLGALRVIGKTKWQDVLETLAENRSHEIDDNET